MTSEERDAWVNLKITKDTFKKTPQEKIDLYNAKKEHRRLIKNQI